jgi:hypothetical protein
MGGTWSCNIINQHVVTMAHNKGVHGHSDIFENHKQDIMWRNLGVKQKWKQHMKFKCI